MTYRTKLQKKKPYFIPEPYGIPFELTEKDKYQKISTPRSREISEHIRKGKLYAKLQRKYGYIPKRFLRK